MVLPKEHDVRMQRVLGGLAASASQLVLQAGPRHALVHTPPSRTPHISQRVQAEQADETGWVFVASLARPELSGYWLVDYAAFSLDLAEAEPQLVLGDLRVDQHYPPSERAVVRPPAQQLHTAEVLGALASGFEGLVRQVTEVDAEESTALRN